MAVVVGEPENEARWGDSLVPKPSTPNAVEGLVKLLRRMTSGGRLEVWHFR